MKWSIYLIVLLLFPIPYNGLGQNRVYESRPYIAKVVLTDGSKIKGVFQSATEDAFVLTDYKNGDTLLNTLPDAIESMKILRRGKVARSALYSGLGGAVLGVGLAYIDGSGGDSDAIQLFTTGETAAILGTFTAVLGSGLGMAVGSKSENFKINGLPHVYRSHLSELQTFAMDPRALPAVNP